jgi:hypothetical protein
MNYYYKNLNSSTYYRDNTLKGLYNLRYRKNLTLYNQTLDIAPRSYLMLRFRTDSGLCHNALFQLCSAADEEVRKKSEELLLYLPTDSKMRNDMEKITISVEDNEFIRHYQLIIV